VVAWLGAMDEQGRLGVKRCAHRQPGHQAGLFAANEPEWVELDVRWVRVERSRKFGGPWLGWELLRLLGLDRFLEQTLPSGREEIPWPVMAMVLVLGRLCKPSSELDLAERFYEGSALPDLLGVPVEKVNEDRLYRALDALLPHKRVLEKHLKEKLGELFPLEYDLLLYDITSTYFEGQMERNRQAQPGYSRDHRPDCKQVNIALVVSRCGMPLGYEVYAGNRADATTLEEMVAHVEGLYGRASRIWVVDRGMGSEENVRFLREGGRRYILGTPKNSLRRFERELLSPDWRPVHEGLEMRLVPAPGGNEVFILCRSTERRAKERALHDASRDASKRGWRRLPRVAASVGRSRARSSGAWAGCWARTRGRRVCLMCGWKTTRRAVRNCTGRRRRVGASGCG
jgi:Transposase DDE domain